jgi:hypothetical protein
MTCADRHKQHADARAVCWWVARKRTTLSFPEIGREFDKDHTSVMSGVKRIERLVAADPGGKLAGIAQAVLMSFQSQQFEFGRLSTSGARELSMGTVASVRLEIDSGLGFIGAAE